MSQFCCIAQFIHRILAYGRLHFRGIEESEDLIPGFNRGILFGIDHPVFKHLVVREFQGGNQLVIIKFQAHALRAAIAPPLA